jgi:hypothetical protein
MTQHVVVRPFKLENKKSKSRGWIVARVAGLNCETAPAETCLGRGWRPMRIKCWTTWNAPAAAVADQEERGRTPTWLVGNDSRLLYFTLYFRCRLTLGRSSRRRKTLRAMVVVPFESAASVGAQTPAVPAVDKMRRCRHESLISRFARCLGTIVHAAAVNASHVSVRLGGDPRSRHPRRLSRRGSGNSAASAVHRLPESSLLSRNHGTP